VPTLETFVARFIEGYALANRHKPSGIAAKQTILNVLTVLSVLLKKAVEWDVIDRMPCTIRLLRVAKPSMGFYDFDEYERLVEAAKALDSVTYLVVLLGGDAGLRCGEIIGLERGDVDLAKRQLCIQRSDWRGHVTVPKGGRLRHVPMTARLAAALREHRHLKSQRVLCQDEGAPLTQDMVGDHVRRAARKAGVSVSGAHRLRHTFCSPAMRGAPARAIQELAGHQDLITTQRYMHLSPAAIEGAIRLLEQPSLRVGHGVPTPKFQLPKSPAWELVCWKLGVEVGGVDGTRALSPRPKDSAECLRTASKPLTRSVSGGVDGTRTRLSSVR
jgi:integrase